MGQGEDVTGGAGGRGDEPRMSLDELFAFDRIPGYRADRRPQGLPRGLEAALELPLAEALLGRRSRRFGLGMTLPSGPLAYASDADPVPLSELEEAVLVWLGTGITGLALGDLPPDGLSWMHRGSGARGPAR